MVSKHPCITNLHLLFNFYHITLLFRKFSIVSNFSSFHSEVCHLKETLKKNPFHIRLVNTCVKYYLSERLTEKLVTLTAEVKDFVITISW